MDFRIIIKPNYPTKIKRGKIVIDYDAWISRISDIWPVKNRNVDRDLTKIF